MPRFVVPKEGLTLEGCECHCHCNPYAGTPCQPVIDGVAECCRRYVTDSWGEEMHLYVNIKTQEMRYFPYSYKEGLPVGGPDNAEGTPLWQPWADYGREVRLGLVPPADGTWLGIERRKG